MTAKCGETGFWKAIWQTPPGVFGVVLPVVRIHCEEVRNVTKDYLPLSVTTTKITSRKKVKIIKIRKWYICTNKYKAIKLIFTKIVNKNGKALTTEEPIEKDTFKVNRIGENVSYFFYNIYTHRYMVHIRH